MFFSHYRYPKRKTKKTNVFLIFFNYYISAKLDNQVSQKECFNYYLNNYTFSNKVIGLNEASRHFFNKEIEKLTQIEIAEILVVMINPALYNKRKRPDRVNEKIEEYLEILKTS